MFKDKAFFFVAQEWVNFFAVQTNTATVPTAAMRAGDFSELLNPASGFYSTAKIIRDPLTGQPFPGNIIPANRLSAEWHRDHEPLSAADPGLSDRARPTRSSAATTRRISGRTISGSITGSTTRTSSRTDIRSTTGKPSTPFEGRSRLRERIGTVRTGHRTSTGPARSVQP